MGLAYSYEIAFEKESVDAVLKALTSAVDEESAGRINRSLPWRPLTEGWQKSRESNRIYHWGSGFQGLEKVGHEFEGVHNFSFHIPYTRQLRRDCDKFRIGYKKRRGFIDIAGVWTGIGVGKKYGYLLLEAATSDISCLFKWTPVKDFILKKFAKVSKFIMLDVEEYAIMLYPKNAKIDKELCFPMSWGYGPPPEDEFVAIIMERAEIT